MQIKGPSAGCYPPGMVEQVRRVGNPVRGVELRELLVEGGFCGCSLVACLHDPVQGGAALQ
jgi:hypothetical protein